MIKSEFPIPAVLAPGFITLRYGSGESFTLVISNDSEAVLMEMFKSRLWRVQTSGLQQIDISDSLGNRFMEMVNRLTGYDPEE